MGWLRARALRDHCKAACFQPCHALKNGPCGAVRPYPLGAQTVDFFFGLSFHLFPTTIGLSAAVHGHPHPPTEPSDSTTAAAATAFCSTNWAHSKASAAPGGQRQQVSSNGCIFRVHVGKEIERLAARATRRRIRMWLKATSWVPAAIRIGRKMRVSSIGGGSSRKWGTL